MPTRRVGSQRWMEACLLAGLLCMFSLTQSFNASAHAELLHTSPVQGETLDEAPESITLTFSESVSTVTEGYILHADGGEQTVLEATSRNNDVVINLPPEIQDGSYALQWRVISADSHPISGALTFAVGQGKLAGEIDVQSGESPWVDNALIGVIAAKYIGVFIWLGSLLATSGLRLSRMPISTRSMAVLAGVAIAAGIVELPLLAIRQRGTVPGSLADTLTAIGEIDIASLTSFAMLAVGAILTLFLLRYAQIPKLKLSLVFAGISAISLPLSGHTRSKSPELILILADSIHIVAGAFWLGGLLALGLKLTRELRGKQAESVEAEVSTFNRFSMLATFSVISVAISGGLMAIAITQTWRPLDILERNYGRILGFKIAVVVIVLLIAASNRWLLIPRIRIGAQNIVRKKLRRLVLAELALLVLVLGFSAVLTQQNPTPLQAESDSNGTATIYAESLELDDGTQLEVIVTHLQDGSWQADARISDSEGNFLTDVTDVKMDWYLPSAGIGPLSMSLESASEIEGYRGTVQLPFGGEWEVRFRARTDPFTQVKTTFTVDVP